MMMRTTSIKVLLLLLLCLVAGCSRTVTRSETFADATLTRLALLPRNPADGISRERVQYIEKVLEAELRSRGFVLLDQRLVAAACPAAPCVEALSQLKSQFGVDAFVDLEIASAQKSNFIAGFYNTIAGTLSLLNDKGDTFLTVEHRESERGGVVFDSGQVIQGVIDQLENEGETRVDELSRRFVAELLAELPRPQGAPIDVARVSVSQVELVDKQNTSFEVCADGTANSLATLSIDSKKTNLRQITSGRYCGRYSRALLSDVSKPLFVELRSAYGASARRELAVPSLVRCNLSGTRVQLAHGGPRRIVLACDAAEKPQPCSDTSFCPAAKLLVYKSPQPSGPFTRVGELHNGAWQDPSANQQPEFYRVLAVDALGDLSLPLEVLPQGGVSR